MTMPVRQAGVMVSVAARPADQVRARREVDQHRHQADLALPRRPDPATPAQGRIQGQHPSQDQRLALKPAGKQINLVAQPFSVNNKY